ncbi:phosphoprotein [Menangle virus]|uniref:Phosphoprotein n=1 Tax=Menangle virus TaxID=152219 RepID=Q91MK1_9MONO|nr:phosphoprotein [Menangle virus]
MDNPPSDAEISAWIDKGLDTVEHFLSVATDPARSLGKSTIKPGKTQELIRSAEKLAGAVVQGGEKGDRDNAKKEVTTAAPEPAVRGKVRPIDVEPSDNTYEEVIPSENSKLIPPVTPKKPPRHKDRIMSMMPLQSDKQLTESMESQVFKRGGKDLRHGPSDIGPGAIGGRSQLTGLAGGRESQSGATQYVTQSPSQPSEVAADVETAPASAPYVKEIIHYLQTLETRINNLDWKVDKILSQQSVITQIKHEQHAIKAGIATLEGLITTIKIMDPGVGDGATAAKSKRLFKEAPVVVSGPVIGDNPIVDADTIQLDELARPSLPKTKSQKSSAASPAALSGYKMTLLALIKECIPNQAKRQKFEMQVGGIRNEQDFKNLRREIIRSAAQ